jgi:hypothetical protein
MGTYNLDATVYRSPVHGGNINFSLQHLHKWYSHDILRKNGIVRDFARHNRAQDFVREGCVCWCQGHTWNVW